MFYVHVDFSLGKKGGAVKEFVYVCLTGPTEYKLMTLISKILKRL